MSFLGKLFGSKKEEKGPTTEDAIQKLRATEDLLIKKQEYLQKKIDQELEIAKKNGTTNKRAALQALKRKKRYEQQLAQIDGTMLTIETQRDALEGANTNNAVLTTMKTAADALKSAHQNMNVEDVHSMMDDIAESQDLSKEISEAISNPVGIGLDVDEDDLQRELEELEQEELDKELLNTGKTPITDLPTPAVPTSEPSGRAKTKVEEDEDDMRELEKWAS
ncbi:charged multivesicular body protein 4b isoform X2 [Daktulosphaira vitifoliae]|uniref:charged multivesicular body protein 4b isoform X2 n=1 Tax=Daktulosphaira vitifoliae TaxID=58002 RepID=UPI0021A993C4|nr:charged multivesicular body protein 4b isoform X2 [Daktulosphaira vitifoliae]XP_050541477.1 charged multivesicular body protein 4b isoform X2 [Daktulosphaira vitifoliae]XP_050541561.1 charged multivesicular body protein 4b isoform X2 [Daktulosphaira vitifoliae]